MIDKLDEATLKAADNAVLWLWDTFGLKHIQQLGFLTLLILATGALQMSLGGQKYGIMFWVCYPICVIVYTATLVQTMQLPADLLNAVVSARRRHSVFKIFRWAFPAVGVLMGLASDHVKPVTPHWVTLSFWSTYFMWNLWTDAMSPTKPRKKRRVTLGVLAPQRSGV